jgi:hypothetical protein
MDKPNWGQGIGSEWKCHMDGLVQHITKNGDVVSLLTCFQALAAANLGGCHQFRIIAARLA